MANLKEIRNRIASVSSTMQITSAMKMVSAAKLKKAQNAITAMRPYANKLTELIQNLSGGQYGESQNPYTVQRAEEKILIIAVTSNRGLCGAFNTNIIKETLRLAKEDYAGKTIEVMGIGKKGGDILSKTLPITTYYSCTPLVVYMRCASAKKVMIHLQYTVRFHGIIHLGNVMCVWENDSLRTLNTGYPPL